MLLMSLYVWQILSCLIALLFVGLVSADLTGI